MGGPPDGGASNLGSSSGVHEAKNGRIEMQSRKRGQGTVKGWQYQAIGQRKLSALLLSVQGLTGHQVNARRTASNKALQRTSLRAAAEHGR